MASLDAVNTFDVDLSVARDREELHINSSSLWITLVDPSTQDAGSVILDLSSYYTDNSPINATTGFNIRSIRGLDRIYISNTVQPGKRLRINYSNTIIYRPYNVTSSSSSTPTTPASTSLLTPLTTTIPNKTSTPVKIFDANPKRIWLMVLWGVNDIDLLLYSSTSPSDLVDNCLYIYNSIHRSYIYGDVYARSTSGSSLTATELKAIELVNI